MRRAGLIVDVYYAALYAPIAVSLTFLPVWMRGLGLSERDIGLVGAIGIALRVLASPVASHAADRLGRRKPLLLALVAGAGIASGFYLAVETFLGVLLVYAATGIFASCIVPIGESIAVPSIRRLGLDYGMARRWGSISVVLMSVLLGGAVDGSGAAIVPWFLVASYVLLLPAAGLLPETAAPAEAPRPRAPVVEILRDPSFVLLLGSAALVQGSHAVFYFYGSFLWLDGGMSATAVGWLWAFGVGCEVAAFSASRRLGGRFGTAGLIGMGAAAGLARWSLLAFDDGLGTAVVVQLLQGGSLALTQAGAARFIATRVPPGLVSSASGVYFAFGYGIFSAVGAYAGGLVFSRAGGLAFLLAAGACAVALACALRLPRGAQEAAR
ncbi:MFS transporter, partial [Arenibaculum sp.]|uniref:MFS transporter n=1 Tax=Arenibaculum sp. TaxID=2865862 RepID=UPI002E13D46A|nr:MFS transporter [Arenibaculum sp.]